MPIRIYTDSPARQLLDDRAFAIMAWTDGSHLGEVYAIVYTPDGTPSASRQPGLADRGRT